MRSELRNALPILAATYGEQFGTRIVITGHEAKTDGKTIYLPAISDPALKDVVIGYLIHESGHVRDTLFNAVPATASALLRTLVNIFEDVRIERLMMETWPGARRSLNAVNQFMHQEGLFQVPTDHVGVANQLIAYLLYRCGVAEWACPTFQTKYEASEKVLRRTLPGGFFTRLEVLMDHQYQTMGSTGDALRLSKSILRAIEEAEAEERQNEGNSQGKPQQPENGESTKDSSADSSGNGGDTGATANQQSGEQISESTDGHDAQASERSEERGQEQGGASVATDTGVSQEGGDGAGSLVRAMEESLNDPQDRMQELATRLTSEQTDKNVPNQLRYDLGQQMPIGRSDNLRAGILTSGPLRARLEGLLQAESLAEIELRSVGRRIEGRRLYRARTGNTNVFVQRHEKAMVNTAVHLLIDRSGSMNGARQTIANDAAVALTQAMTAIPHADLAVSAFPGERGSVSPVIHRGQSARQNLGRFDMSSEGGTPMTEAIYYAVRELAYCNQPRKVIIVVTDGAPNDRVGVRYLTELIQGEIDVIGIGIQSEAVQSCFSSAVTISDVRELPNQLFGIVRQFLRAA